MKRSSSEVSPAPSNESDIDIDLDIKSDFTSLSRRTKKTPSPLKSNIKSKPKSPKKVSKEGDLQNGEWDKEKRAVFMDLIIAAGYKAVNLDEVSASVSSPYTYASMVVLMISWAWGRNS